jgi:prepilin-type N-terminal cleavage/methylation domain-containing protein
MRNVRQRAKGETEQGFTLVEILVVLAVSSLMAGMIIVMTSQFRNIVAIDRSLSEQAALQKTANYMATLIEQAEALPLDLNSILNLGLNSGSPFQSLESPGNAVRFLAVNNRQTTTPSLFEYSFTIEETGEGQELIETRKARRLNVDSALPAKTVLLENVRALSFQFFQNTSSNSSEQVWKKTWQDTAGLPALVEIRIEKQQKSGAILQAIAMAYIMR